jgi:HD superfamily phosphohydrolase
VLRDAVRSAAPKLAKEIDGIVGPLLGPALSAIRHSVQASTAAKVFNDSVWGSIWLSGHEVAIHDSPLLQRLDGIKQLGMAYRVYPGARHTRLEHTRGVLVAATKLLRSLEQRRKHYRLPQGELTPPSPTDEMSIRLAALFHDVAHGPCSHVTERLLPVCSPEYSSARSALLEALDDVLDLAPAELLAAMFVLSEPMRDVFEALRSINGDPALPDAVAARILGSRLGLRQTYVAPVLSGPLDADKLDYMQRDSKQCSIEVGLDVDRLIGLVDIVEGRDGAPILGIARAGLGAYEQFIVARVLLYDRVYFHHKVRAAEEMLLQLIRTVEEESGHKFEFRHFYLPVTDETFIAMIGGLVGTSEVPQGKERSALLAHRLLGRNLYNRAFSIASRFDKRLEPVGKGDSPAAITAWNDVKDSLGEEEGKADFVSSVVSMADKLSKAIPDLSEYAGKVSSDEVVVDLPPNKVVVRKGEILTKAADSTSQEANLFFRPEEWSQAFEERKRQGAVFCSKSLLPVVSLASKICFFDKFKLHMDQNADRESKTLGIINPAWVDAACKAGLCSQDFFDLEISGKELGLPFSSALITVPVAFLREEPKFPVKIVDELNAVLTAGVSRDLIQPYSNTIIQLIEFIKYAATRGLFATSVTVDEEKDLQGELVSFLRPGVKTLLRARRSQVARLIFACTRTRSSRTKLSARSKT